MKCFECSGDASHYVEIIAAFGSDWEQHEGTDSNYVYSCPKHISVFVNDYTGADGVQVLEIKAELLGLTSKTGGL